MTLAKRFHSSRLKLAGIILTLFLLMPQLGAMGPKSGKPLHGTWAFTITSEPNPVQPSTIILLATFNTDGTFLSNSDLPPIPVDAPFLKVGTGHGIWEREAAGSYSLRTWILAF